MNVRIFILFVSSFYSFLVLAQDKKTEEAYIAPFKNNARGAYTLIHDDFGAYMARGIEAYADTMAYSRKIPICFAAITKECGKKDWIKAHEMIAHGHQIINHSMSHKCGIKEAWCTSGDWDEHDFNVEIDSSTTWIERNTGKHPAFFVYPYDQFTDTMIRYTQHLNYLGARAGKKGLTHPADQLTPFHLNFEMHRPENKASTLDSFARVAITNKAWGIRVVHGVGDDSWGSLNPVDYGKHLDVLATWRKENQLWLATLSDVVTYQYMKTKYPVAIKQKDSAGRVTRLSFTDNPSIILPDQKLLSDKSVTIVVKQKTTSYKEITQGNVHLHIDMRGEEMIIQARPDLGDIVIVY
jgi:hypothetical protein